MDEIWQVLCSDGIEFDLDREQCTVIEKLLFNRYEDTTVDRYDKDWYIGNEIYGNEIRVRLSSIISIHQSTSESRQAYRDRQKRLEEESGPDWANDK